MPITATVTVNSRGNSANGEVFAGLDLYTSQGGETIDTLNGSGTVGLGGGVLSVNQGNFTGQISDGRHNGFPAAA